MKRNISEAQLMDIVENSTLKILSEAMEKEGVGSKLGGFFGNVFKKTRQGISDFKKGFNDEYGKSENSGSAKTSDDSSSEAEKPKKSASTTRKKSSTGGQSKDQIIQNLKDENQRLKQQLEYIKYGNASDNDYEDSGMLVGQKKKKTNPKIDDKELRSAHAKMKGPIRKVNTKPSGIDLVRKGVENFKSPDELDAEKRKALQPNYFPKNTMDKNWDKTIFYESKKAYLTEEKLIKCIEESLKRFLKHYN